MSGKPITTTEFISRACGRYGNRYDYTNSKYINNRSKITIKCNSHDIVFSQTPNSHMKGHLGCNVCSREQRIKTNNMVYGGNAPISSQLVQDKIKNTNLDRYGVEHTFQSDNVKNKIKEVILTKYGVENVSQSKAIKDKKRASCLKNHGVEYTLQSKKLREQVKSTCINKYGFENPSQSPYIKRKIEKTMISHWGTRNYSQRNMSTRCLDKLNDKSWLSEQHHIHMRSLSDIALELNVTHVTVSTYFKKHRIKVERFLRSSGEIALTEYIKSLGYDILINQWDIIPPFEIDIFIPDINVALEYNGLYWHRGKSINYHENKTTLCKIQGIHLIHIWEDKWLYNKSQIKKDIVRILNNKPLQKLTNQIVIDLSFENPKTYLLEGYEILKETSPQIYSDGIWDCGEMTLKRNIL